MDNVAQIPPSLNFLFRISIPNPIASEINPAPQLNTHNTDEINANTILVLPPAESSQTEAIAKNRVQELYRAPDAQSDES